MADEAPIRPPNAEKLLVSWMMALDPLTSLVPAGRIVTELGKQQVFPAIRVIRIGGPRELWLDHPLLQVDVWGGPKAVALEACDLIAAHGQLGLIGVHDAGVVTEVVIGGPQWLPDKSYSPAKPRYIFDVLLTTHP